MSNLVVFQRWSELQPFRRQWDQLTCEHPFYCWPWIDHWWRQFGGRYRAAVIADRQCAGGWRSLVPGYIEGSPLGGHTLRLMSDRRAAADYAGIVAASSDPGALTPLAEGLVCFESIPVQSEFPSRGVANSHRREQRGTRLDSILWEGIEAGSENTRALIDIWRQSGATVHSAPQHSTWVLDLRGGWTGVRAAAHKSIRRKISKAQSRLDSGNWQIQAITEADMLQEVWPQFVMLHQLRRTSLGQEGCFADPRFNRFLSAATRDLMSAGGAALLLIRRQGQAVAANLLRTAGDTAYMYQSGFDPALAQEEVGHLMVTAAVLWACQQQLTRFDFLRGDERYKQQWGASPRASVRLRVATPRLPARVRHAVWLAARSLRDWTVDRTTFARKSNGTENHRATENHRSAKSTTS